MNEHELDNMDKSNVQDVAYYIWRECEHIDDPNVMGTAFRDACRSIAENEFPHMEWSEIWEEIENYLY